MASNTRGITPSAGTRGITPTTAVSTTEPTTPTMTPAELAAVAEGLVQPPAGLVGATPAPPSPTMTPAELAAIAEGLAPAPPGFEKVAPVPAKPTIVTVPSKAPPPKAPLPKAPPPTEPAPKGVAPTVLGLAEAVPDTPGAQVATIDAVKYYIPGSTMYGLGYRTVEEYERAQQRGILDAEAGAPWVTIQGVQISRTAATKLSKLKDEPQFNEAVRLGIVPEDSAYIPSPVGEWSYISQDEADTLRKEQPEAYNILTTQGWDAYNKLITGAAAELSDFISDGELDITSAVEAGIPVETMRRAGYQISNEAYNAVKKQVSDIAALEKEQARDIVDFETWIKSNDAPKVLKDAYASGGLEGYNQAVAEYNETLQIASAVFPPEGETALVSSETSDYAHSPEFLAKYIAVVRPPGMSDADYAKLTPYISPSGFDTGGAIVDGVPIPLIERFTGLDLTGPPTPALGLLPAPINLRAVWPKGIPSSPPKGFPSDEEYANMTTVQKLNLAKEGDIRATFAVATWEEGLRAVSLKLGVEKPIEAATTKLIPALDPVYQDLKLRLDADPTNEKIQQEMSAYWEQYGRAALQSVAIVSAIPALVVSVPAVSLGSVPILSRVTKTAIGLGIMLARVTPTVYAAASLAETTKAGNLERQWQNFQTLPEGQQDFWVKQAGFSKSFASLTEAEKAFVLLRYTPPTGVTLGEWGEKLGEIADQAHEYVQKGANWVRKNTPESIKFVTEPVVFATGTVAGAVVEAPIYLGMLPVIGASLVDTVPSGKAKDYATEVAIGMAAFFTTVIPAAFKADPSYTSGRIVGLFILGPGGLLKLAKGLGARLNLRSYVPERGMAIEYSTVKTPTRLGAGGELAIRDAVEVAMRRLLEGEQVVEVPVGDGLIILRYKGTVYQKYAPNTLFSAVTDIKAFDPTNPGKLVLWTSPQLARRFMVGSASGQPMKSPGIVEVYVGRSGFGKLPKNVHDAATLARMEQLASEALKKGYKNPQFYPPFKDYIARVELEATSVGLFKRIPGRGGKGVSSNIEAGSYPIQRYVLDGLGLEGYKGLSTKQVLMIRAASFAEGVKTFFLGNYGRLEALKAELGVKGVKAEFPSLRAMLRNEGYLKTIAEVIHGRERALKIKGAKSTEATVLEAIAKGDYLDPKWRWTDSWFKRLDKLSELINKETDPVKHRRLVQRHSDLTIKLVNRMANLLLREEMGQYKPIFDRLTKDYGYSREYGRGYISAYERLVYSALGRSTPSYREDIVERTEYSPYRELVERPDVITPRIERIEPERVGIPEARPRLPEREPERPISVARIREEPPREKPERPPRPPREPIEPRPPREPIEPRPPREPPPPRKPPPPPVIIAPRAEISGKRARLPDGSIAWRQGIFWKYIPPPWNQGKATTLPKGIIPMGAVKTDLRTPKETIQKIGETEAQVPKSVSADLGPFDLEITNYGQNIRYVSGGERTNVGEGIASTTKGMSIPSKGISRVAMSKEAPPRVGRRPEPEPVRETAVSGVKERPAVAKAKAEYLDEDEDWLSSLEPFSEHKPKSRSKSGKTSPRRIGRREEPPTVIRGVRS